MPIATVAIFRTNAGSEDTVEALFRSVIAPTHAEEGCIMYQLNRDPSDPRRFVWIEEWESKELLDRHLASAHIKKLFDVDLKGHIETGEVIPLEIVAGRK